METIGNIENVVFIKSVDMSGNIKAYVYHELGSLLGWVAISKDNKISRYERAIPLTNEDSTVLEQINIELLQNALNK